MAPFPFLIYNLSITSIEDVSRKRTNKHNLRRWLGHYFKRYWPGVLLLTLISFAIVGFQLLEPWPVKILVDSVFGTIPLPSFLENIKHTNDLILLVATSIVVIYGLETLLSWIKHQFSNWLALRLDFHISSDFFDRVQHLSLSALNKESSGDYTYRQNAETSAVSTLLVDTTNDLIKSALTIVGITVIMLKINFSLALISLVIAPLLYLSIRFFSHRIEKAAEKVEESNSDIYSYTTESIENVRLIQSFSKEQTRLNGLQGMLRLNIKFRLRYTMTDEGFTFINDTLATMAMAVLVILGAHKVIGGQLTVGDLLIFLTYLSYLYTPLQTFSTAVGDAKAHLASAKRVFEVFGIENIVKESANPQHLDKAKGHIEFRGVGFSYGDRKILHNIDLDIKPGQKIAIIGHSGSGKSTVLSLLPRFYDAQQGQILIDGIDIKELDLKDLRRQFSIVAQEAPVLATSVANNVAFAHESGLPEPGKLIWAAKAANAHEFITKLPLGYKTEVGERGSNLSGGQRQRLAIARAFLKDAPILLLDEPTSALDRKSEEVVIEALHKLMAGRTTLIVSHNAGTLVHADVIYLMDEGKIVDKVERTNKRKFQRLIDETKEAG